MIRTFFLGTLLLFLAAGCGGGAIVEHARAAQLISRVTRQVVNEVLPDPS